MTFHLEIEEDWPPVAVENIWVEAVSDGHFRVDNLPFFAMDVSLDDIVAGRIDEDGRFAFERVVARAGAATVRLIVRELGDVDAVIEELVTVGCVAEALSPTFWPRLISVSIPPEIPYDRLRDVLLAGKHIERWGLEESSFPPWTTPA